MLSKNKKRAINNVLYVSNSEYFLGGAQRSIYELLKNVDKSKVNPYFASTKDGELAKAIKELGIPFLRLHQFHRTNPLPFILSLLKLVILILKNEIDIIHNNQCFDARYSWIAGKITRTPIIIHHRDTRYYRLDRLLIKHVEYNVCISNWQNRELLDCRAVVIHNGIELDKFNPVSESCQNKDGRIEVGLIGRIYPNKGQDVLIRAAKLVLSSNDKVHFKIIGDINTEAHRGYKNYLRSLVLEYHLENAVEFTGYANDVVNALGQLDISVVPSWRESFGRVIIESMACYKPVIATQVGGALDIVTDETGILIPVGDHVALAKALCQLIENPALRIQMGIAGRKRVEKCFTIENTLAKIYALYAEIQQRN